jgi:hypothetical protein
VEKIGRQTRIVLQPSGQIAQEGINELLISYRFTIEPRICFSSDLQGFNTRVTLFDQRYTFYTRAIFLHEEPESGQATLMTLSSSSFYNAGFEGRYESSTYGGDLGKQLSGSTDTRFLQGFWRHSQPYAKGTLSVNVLDRYSLFAPRYGAGPTIEENVLSAGLKFRRTLSQAITHRASGDLSTRTSGSDTSNAASLGIDLQARLGKTLISLTSDFDWWLRPSAKSQAQNVALQFSRYF